MSVNVGTAVAYLDLDMSRFTSGITQARSALRDFSNSTEDLSTRFKNLGSSISSAGMTLTKNLTLPIAGIGTAAAAVAGDFDQSMSKVQAISAATAEEMEALRDKAIEMGAKTKFSAKESADAFTYMAMAGWDAGQMIEGIGGIMSLAAADGLDLATTSDIVTDALTAFGLQASDSAHFADVLAQASSSANTNVSMLGESFKFVAPVAGALGMSVEDVAIALGLMANSGIKGSQAGTALRASLTNLVKPTDAMSKKLEELGIEVENSDGTMKSLRDIMDILRDKFSRLTESEQANAAATLFGKEAMSGMLAIINTSETDYLKLASAIDTASGRADSMAETMMDNLPGAIEQLKGAIESLMIRLGEALVPTIQKITELITRWVEKLNTLSDEQIEQIVQIAAVVAAIGPVLVIVGKVISIIGSVITVGGQLIAGIKVLVGFIGGTLIPAITSISAPVLAVIAVIGALIAAGVALYKNWDEVSAWAKEAWQSVKETIGSVAEAVGEFFSDLGQTISDIFTSIGESISDIGDSISSFIDDMLQFFSDFGSSLVDSISNVVSSIAEWGSNLLSKAREIGSNFYNSVISGVKDVAEFFSDMFTNVLSTITGFGSKMFQAGKKLLTSFWDGIKEVFNSIKNWFTESLGKLFDPVKDIFDKLFSPVKNLFSGVGNLFSGLFSGSHANGLDYVPYNGYLAQLHQGERVLTKEENKDYKEDNRSSGDTFNFYSPEAIDEYKAARLMKQTKKEMDMDM